VGCGPSPKGAAELLEDGGREGDALGLEGAEPSERALREAGRLEIADRKGVRRGRALSDSSGKDQRRLGEG